MRKTIVALLLSLTLASPSAAAHDLKVTLEDLTLLAASDLADDTILAFLEPRALGFELDAETIAALRRQGVSDEVIRYLLDRSDAPRDRDAELIYLSAGSYPSRYYALHYYGHELYPYFGYPILGHWTHGYHRLGHHLIGGHHRGIGAGHSLSGGIHRSTGEAHLAGGNNALGHSNLGGHGGPGHRGSHGARHGRGGHSSGGHSSGHSGGGHSGGGH